MQSRKTALCEELERIDAILARLRQRRSIGPDMSSDDLLELFREERERLFSELHAVNDERAGEADEDATRNDAHVVRLHRGDTGGRPDV